VNKILGVVGNDYRPLQNKDAFVFFDTLVEQGEARYETCGALKEGKQIWLLSKVEGQFDVLAGDTINKYILLTNRHDGLGCVQARFTPIRVVCNNTLSAAIGRRIKDEIRIVHKGDVANKLEFASTLLKKTGLFFDELCEQYKSMARIQLNEQKLTSYLQMALRPYYGTTPTEDQEEVSRKLRNEVIQVKRLHEEGAGADIRGVRGTLWGAYNAVTEYVDHFKKPKRSEAIEFMGFGSGKLIKDHALSLAVRYMKTKSFSTKTEALVLN
jgi:phage/plasmid-like protein (TIGR03299 family)